MNDGANVSSTLSLLFIDSSLPCCRDHSIEKKCTLRCPLSGLVGLVDFHKAGLLYFHFGVSRSSDVDEATERL